MTDGILDLMVCVVGLAVCVSVGVTSIYKEKDRVHEFKTEYLDDKNTRDIQGYGVVQYDDSYTGMLSSDEVMLMSQIQNYSRLEKASDNEKQVSILINGKDIRVNYEQSQASSEKLVIASKYYDELKKVGDGQYRLEKVDGTYILGNIIGILREKDELTNERMYVTDISKLRQSDVIVGVFNSEEDAKKQGYVKLE